MHRANQNDRLPRQGDVDVQAGDTCGSVVRYAAPPVSGICQTDRESLGQLASIWWGAALTLAAIAYDSDRSTGMELLAGSVEMSHEGITAQSRAVEAEYDRLSALYDRRWREYIDATLRIVEDVIDCKGRERILDAPCGTGELARRLLVRWPSVRIVGVDLSRGMLMQARAKDWNGSVQWMQTDVEALPTSDGTFDWVICANSFHYFRSPSSALRESFRVLRPGGRLVLVDWCDDFWSCKLCSLWLRWTDPAFNRTYSLRQCRTLLEHAGFRIENAKNCRVGWIWGLMRFVCRRPED